MALDEQKVEEAVGKVFGELGVAITGPLVVLGDRLGLWAAMAELSYYWALPDNTRLVPKLTFDWMRTRTDAFSEIGVSGGERSTEA